MKKVLLVLFVLALAAWATPNLISYQGKLDRDGSPFTGTASMEFALFETETGSTPFWNEIQSVTVTDGIFNVLLGSVTELPALPTDGCWLEVVIDGDALPRQQITSVPYSQIADQAYSYYQTVEDTAMDYTCPADGILLVGYWLIGEGLNNSISLYVDDIQIVGPQGSNMRATACGAIAVEEGLHRIRIKGALYALTEVRLWAIFMR